MFLVGLILFAIVRYIKMFRLNRYKDRVKLKHYCNIKHNRLQQER